MSGEQSAPCRLRLCSFPLFRIMPRNNKTSTHAWRSAGR